MMHARPLLLAIACGALLSGQVTFQADEVRLQSGPYVPPAPANTLRTQVTLVEVPVVVRDGKGHAVGGLGQDKFEVYDAGKRQTISHFTVETFTGTAAAADASTAAGVPAGTAPVAAPAGHAPRYIVLCFDNLTTAFDDLKRSKDAAVKFVQTALAPGDLMTVITTASSQTVSFTDEVPKLVEAIGKVTLQKRQSEDLNNGCPRITAYQAYLITNHMDNGTLEGVSSEDMACKGLRHPDAVSDVQNLSRVLWEQSLTYSRNILYSIESIVDGLGKMPGRRMLLLASSGFLGCDLEYQEDELITRAVHAEVVINALNAKGLITYNGGRPIDAPPPRGSRGMRTQIAEAQIEGRQAQAKDDGMAVLAIGTGGKFFTNNNDLAKGFNELGALPETVYVLGFAPSDAGMEGRFHALKVKLAAGNHYSLQSRMGYTAPKKPGEAPAPSPLDVLVAGSGTPSDVPCSMTLVPGEAKDGMAMVSLVVRVDARNLAYQDRSGRRAQKLTFVATLVNGSGAFVTGARGEMELAFKPETLDRLGNQGFNVRLPLRAPAGTYTVRGVVQESLGGKMSAWTATAELK